MTQNMLADADIRRAVEEAFRPSDQTSPEPIDLDLRIEAMGVDSLRLSQIILSLEGKLNIMMPDEVLNELGRSETLGDLYRTLSSHYAARAA